MALSFYLFAASLAVGLVASTVCLVRFGLNATETRLWLLMTGCVCLSYVVGLGFVCYDPYFDDNGVKEFISWRYRWAWAAMFAGLFQFVLVPCGLAVYGLWRRLYAENKTAVG